MKSPRRDVAREETVAIETEPTLVARRTHAGSRLIGRAVALVRLDRVRPRLIPGGQDPPIGGPTILLWLYAVILPVVVLCDPSGDGLRWWGVFGLMVAALGGLIASYRLRAAGQSSPTWWGLLSVALLTVAMVSAAWCAAESRYIVLVIGGLIYLLATLYARRYSRLGTLLVAIGGFVSVYGITWWSHVALTPEQAVDPRAIVILSWTVGFVGLGSRHFVTVLQERAEMQRLAADPAQVDPLTGLPNRSGFAAAAERAIAEAARGGPLCSVMVIDLDGLKDINDSFGHPVGDAALRRMGAAIQACAEPEEVVAHLGGDEFAVLAVHERGVPVENVAARFAGALESTLLEDPASNRKLLLSASWGLATCGQGTTDLTALLIEADEHLIRHKATARTSRPQAGAEDAPYVPRGRRTMAEALASLLEMTRDVAAAVDGDEFLRRAASRSAELIGAVSCAVTIDRGKERWGYRARRSAEGWVYTPTQVPSGRSIIGHVMETGRPYLTNDVSNDPYVNVEAAKRLGAISSLCVPMRGGDGRPIGTVLLTNKLGRAPFTDQDTVVAQAFADLTVTALEKTEALAAAREEMAVSKALLRAVNLVHTALDPDEVVSYVVREAMALIDAEAGAVALVGPDGLLRVTSFRRTGLPMVGIPRIRVGEGIVGHVALTARSYLTNDLASDPMTPRAEDEQSRFRSQLSVPVRRCDGTTMAVITLFNAGSSGSFTNRHRGLLEAFAQHAAVALDRAEASRASGSETPRLRT
jgi:diguanylate cyclase (GGDEF)-like protein